MFKWLKTALADKEDGAGTQAPAPALTAEDPFQRGAALREQGRILEAIASFRRAAALAPESADAHLAMGELYAAQGNLDEAISAFRAALALRPAYAELHLNLGALYRKRGRPDEALACYREAVRLKPEFHAAHFNLGNLLGYQGRLAEAEASYRLALAGNDAFVAAHHNLGDVLKDQGRLAEAMACYERALALDPAYTPSFGHRMMLRLLTGDFQRGLPDFEQRQRLVSDDPPRTFSQPPWLNDADIRGKTILLYAEQGFGDTIQFVRYAGRVAALGARVVLEVQAPLKPLLSSFPGVAAVVARGEPLPPFDVRCALMSLPLAFRTELDSIPADRRYLSAPPERTAHWAAQLKTDGVPRVGVVWSGNSGQSNDANRSMSLAQLSPLLSDARFRFYALVKEVRGGDRALLQSLPNVTDLSSRLTDFAETAAILENLDLLMSVDTSVAHLGCALGRPAWIMLSFVPDWRWFIGRTDSPWYPTAKLFRQASLTDWESVVAHLKAELELFHEKTGKAG